MEERNVWTLVGPSESGHVEILHSWRNPHITQDVASWMNDLKEPLKGDFGDSTGDFGDSTFFTLKRIHGVYGLWFNNDMKWSWAFLP